MPEMDGYQATREIRAVKTLQTLPVIAMTAHALVEERERCLAAGMNDHVTKPVDPGALYQTLARCIGRVAGAGAAAPLARPPADAAATALPEIPGIDVESGIARVVGNQELYRRLLVSFAESQRDVAAQIHAALKAGDGGLAERLAHTVKGTAGSIGATRLQEAAGVLEHAIRAAPEEAWRGEPLAQFAAALQHATSAIDSAIVPRAVEASPSDPASPEELSRELRHLQAALAEFDAEAAGHYQQLRGKLRGVPAEVLHELGQQIEEFDFEEAAGTLASIAEALGIEP
jgi:CheY-like chemotaxis protein